LGRNQGEQTEEHEWEFAIHRKLVTTDNTDEHGFVSCP
jgi:hypothetical protein